MQAVRNYIGSLLEPLVGGLRAYRVDPRPGLMPHFTVAGDSLLLHLLANTGNKSKKLRMREEYLPIPDVRVRIRVPQGRQVTSARLVRAQRPLPLTVTNGWFDATIPQVHIHELVELSHGLHGSVRAIRG
jgi:hypothetical protein